MKFCLLLLCLALAGCTAAFRSQTGSSTVREGASGGTMNSIYVSDRGGPLTRVGLMALGAGMAASSIQNVKQSSTVTDNGDGTVTVRTETTGTVDVNSVQAATDLINAAADPHHDFAGLTGGLEIATTSLGGDTDGWRFELGYRHGQPISEHFDIDVSVHASIGSFIHHNRMLKTLDATSGQVMMTMGDAPYDIAALPIRIAFPYRFTPTTSLGPVIKIEPNIYPIENNDDIEFYPSPWSIGGRLTLAKYAYIELLGSASATRASATSVNLEVGIDAF